MILTKTRIELLCSKEFVLFIARHPRYITPVLILYLRIFFTLRSTTLLRAAFAFTQGMDDILDADRAFAGSRRKFADLILAELRREEFICQTSMSRFAEFIILQKPDLKSGLADLIEVLIFDNIRMEEKLVLTDQQLSEHHYKTFEISIRLLLNILEKDVPYEVISSVARSLAWCSVMRDLEDDLARGLNNIPQRVWSKLSTPILPQHISKEPVVAQWIWEEYEGAKVTISQAFSALKKSESKVLLFFMIPVQRYHRRYHRRYGFLPNES